ncbi:TetR family transcriptional regulator [Mycobacterium sp. ITM-2016-00317]|uniref:TetR family transcriptional regulator n=1 Tax=Mycobacterium sp. ITM-2016-00317 TaxID=2099694 RepID=UPI000D4D6A52|nr:TetR family transcriptional regulator [Mycobacterium sp. ITM-2016-00317]WNG87972.1 TetR family transcriptional regulator [Mycobacterium sp. ITM-2016-00317]
MVQPGRDAADKTDEVGARILAAALELLRARGPRAVTMQAVVEATGIAKTTIYRRHQNRRALLTAALATLGERPSVPPDSTREQRIQWVVSQSVDVIADGIGAGGFAALLTGEDPEFSAAFRDILGAYRRQAMDALQVDRITAHPPPDGFADTLIDMIVGSYVAELARADSISDDWHTRIASAVGALLAAQT